MILKNVVNAQTEIQIKDVRILPKPRQRWGRKERHKVLTLPYNVEVTVPETDWALRSYETGDISKLVTAGQVQVVAAPTRTAPPA